MNTAREPESGHELAYFLDLIGARKVYLLVSVLLFGAVATAAAFMSDPVYRSTIVLFPAESSMSTNGLSSMLGDLGGIGSLAGIKVGQSEGATEALALLRSRQFTESFIRDEGLLHVLYAKRWDARKNAWKPLRWFDDPTMDDAIKKFDKEVRSISEQKSGLITMSIEWTDSVAAAHWANSLVSRLNETMRLRTIGEADATIALLNKEMQQSNVTALQQAISRTLESQVKTRSLANVRPDYIFRVVDPGVRSEKKDFIRPQRALYMVGGPIVGFTFGIFLVVVLDFVKRYKMTDLL